MYSPKQSKLQTNQITTSKKTAWTAESFLIASTAERGSWLAHIHCFLQRLDFSTESSLSDCIRVAAWMSWGFWKRIWDPQDEENLTLMKKCLMKSSPFQSMGTSPNCHNFSDMEDSGLETSSSNFHQDPQTYLIRSHQSVCLKAT